MRLDWLHRLTEHTGPFATVVTDVSRDDATGDREIRARWRDHAERLAGLGAPAGVVDALRPVVVSATRRGGQVGRVVVAGTDGLLLDQVLPERPVGERTTWGPVPDLVPVVRALSGSTSYVLAEVNAAGALLQAVSARGDELEAATVVGEHDVLDQVPGSGWAHRRVEVRVEDSAQHDAAELAGTLASQVRRHRPDVVLVAGTDEPVAALLEHCLPAVTERLVRLWSGGRAEGSGGTDLADEVRSVLDERSRRRTRQLLDRFARAQAVGREAVTGLPEVVAAFQRDQVDELLLADREVEHHVWATGGLDAVAPRDRAPVRADVALVWSAVGAGARVTLVPVGCAGALTDGVGALLRWVDAA